MKNLLLLITLSLFSVISNATTFYVSPAGNDANPGTITQPFKSLSKLSSVMVAGDIAYLRGNAGDYTSTNNNAGVQFDINGLNGTSANPINIQAYPGEVPTFNLNNISPTAFEPYGMAVTNCNYVKLKGHIIIKNFKQPADGFSVSRGFMLTNSNQCTIEWLEVFNIMGPAFKIESSNDNLFLNCDAHHNGDGWSRDISSPTVGSDKWDNSDGFSCSSNPTLPAEPSTRITFRYCRAWMNSDDGWDVLGTGNNDGTGIFTMDGCWSFWNSVLPWGTSSLVENESLMTPGTLSLFQNNSSYWSTSGNSGEGFKLGDTRTPTTQVLHYLTNCLSFQNKGTGFASNSINAVTGVHQLLNCVAYDNDNDGFSFGAGWCVGTNQRFRNNWSYGNNKQASGGDWVYDGNNNSNISNNVWPTVYQGVNYGNLYPGIQISNADFVSVSSAGVDGARQSNGALPVLNFLHLATGSDLINAGVNVGLPYLSTAPDLGAFESNGSTSNLTPTANAGADQSISLPTSSVNLTGSGTDPDGSIASYVWSKISGPTSGTITNATAATTAITGLVQGTYQFELKVTDNGGATSTDIMLVIVNAAPINITPTANAGADKTVVLPISTVSLTGTGTDTDGTIAAYSWTKVSGPTGGTIATATTAATSISGLIQGIYKFELKVTDNIGATGKDTVQVTVNAAGNQVPVTNAGADKTVVLPTSTVSLTGTGTDTDGTIAAYLWTKVSGPAGGTIATATTAATSISGLVQGIYKFELKVTDNIGATGKDTVQVTVNAAGNQVPVANAGADKTIVLPTSTVSLTGTGTDTDGTIAAYLWTKVSGPAGGTIATATTAATSIGGLIQGIYKFELKVTDNIGATGKDTVQVTVNAATTPNNAYGGVRWAIPGMIEAENFDNGGQNVAYYDNTTGNNGGIYRTSDFVDIQTSSEISPNIGWITAGEWMKYSVNVTGNAVYTIEARVACPLLSKSFQIEMDGVTIATVNVPLTGSSQAWQTVTITGVNLTAGEKIMRIYSTKGGYNINYIKFTATTPLTAQRSIESAGTSVTTFPLPFSTSFTVNIFGETTGEYNLTLVDLSGNTVWKKTVTKEKETLTENIYMGNLQNGVYILQVVTPDQKQLTHKLIKN